MVTHNFALLTASPKASLTTFICGGCGNAHTRATSVTKSKDQCFANATRSASMAARRLSVAYARNAP